MNSLVAAGLAGLLAVGTIVGVVAAANSNTQSRSTPNSTAPVYGTR